MTAPAITPRVVCLCEMDENDFSWMYTEEAEEFEVAASARSGVGDRWQGAGMYQLDIDSAGQVVAMAFLYE